MHRLIMLSSVYQESSVNNPRYAQVDPNNRLLWRANIRRLEFEPLRDSLLAIGGKLDTNMFGRPVDRASLTPRAARSTDISTAPMCRTGGQFDFANPDFSGRRQKRPSAAGPLSDEQPAGNQKTAKNLSPCLSSRPVRMMKGQSGFSTTASGSVLPVWI